MAKREIEKGRKNTKTLCEEDWNKVTVKKESESERNWLTHLYINDPVIYERGTVLMFCNKTFFGDLLSISL